MATAQTVNKALRNVKNALGIRYQRGLDNVRFEPLPSDDGVSVKFVPPINLSEGQREVVEETLKKLRNRDVSFVTNDDDRTTEMVVKGDNLDTAIGMLANFDVTALKQAVANKAKKGPRDD